MPEEQTYPPINPVEVEHYDKERSKDHDVSPDIKAQIRELKKSEEDLLSGIDKSDAPSRKKYAADQPSEDIDPKKAKKILEDKEVHGKPLTDKQEGLFGAAAGKEED